MPRLEVAGLVRDIDVVVFDKDGTLIDFDKAWSGRLRRAITAACDQAGFEAGKRGELEAALYRTLGAEPATGAMFPDGPYVSASIVEACTIAAAVLYQSGQPWQRSQAIAATAMRPVFAGVPLPSELATIGDVTGLLTRLRAAGLRLAITTNDERAGTMAGLAALGIASKFDVLVCADDAGLAPKPAPDALLHIARVLGAHPARLAVVGDSVGDLRAGRAAGAGLIIGVSSGPATAALLAPHADAVVADIHALSVAQGSSEH